MHSHYMGHHSQTAPGYLLAHADSTRSAASDNSLEDSALGRSIHRDNSSASQLPHPQRAGGQYRIVEVDPDAIHVIGDAELQQLPEAVNREILKNSREIVYEEDPKESELMREDSFLMMKPVGNKRSFVRYLPGDEEKRSLNESRKNLSNRNLVHEDDKRSLNGSKRNLNGSKRYLLMLEKAESWNDSNRNLYVNSKENLVGTRRHTGSKERLNVMKKSVCGMKGSKETPELRSQRRFNETNLDHRTDVEIEIERPPKLSIIPPSVQVTRPKNNVSPTELVLSPNESIPSPTESLLTSSDLSPESGYVEGSHFSSPENIRRNVRLTTDTTVIARNRRSYEHAQLQDVNEVLSRPSSGGSSDNDSSLKSGSPVGVTGKSGAIVPKQSLSYTSV